MCELSEVYLGGPGDQDPNGRFTKWIAVMFAGPIVAIALVFQVLASVTGGHH